MRSRSVQTDPYPVPSSSVCSSGLGAFPRPPMRGSSATSVYSDSFAPSNNSIERTHALLQRMQAADALSLAIRLKRAGVTHLSRHRCWHPLGRAKAAARRAAGRRAASKRDVRKLLGMLREMFNVTGELVGAAGGRRRVSGVGWGRRARRIRVGARKASRCQAPSSERPRPRLVGFILRIMATTRLAA